MIYVWIIETGERKTLSSVLEIFVVTRKKKNLKKKEIEFSENKT